MLTKTDTKVLKLHANWPAPDNIVAFTTCRTGGVSQAPFNRLNLGLHVGDTFQAVDKNRQLLLNSCDGLDKIQWLNQVHSDKVINADEIGSDSPQADACYTHCNAVGCAVMTADCLPILICDDHGQQVAAVHAGWRGLAGGVIEQTVKTFTLNTGICDTSRLLVWMGPAISQSHFEVGLEVKQAFVNSFPNSVLPAIEQAFSPNPKRTNYYFADLYQLARIRLTILGVNHIYGGEYCCYDDTQRFFSYRRDTITGRMVSLIYKRAESSYSHALSPPLSTL